MLNKHKVLSLMRFNFFSAITSAPNRSKNARNVVEFHKSSKNVTDDDSIDEELSFIGFTESDMLRSQIDISLILQAFELPLNFCVRNALVEESDYRVGGKLRIRRWIIR